MKAHPVTGQNIKQIATINGKSCRGLLKTKDCNGLHKRDTALQHFLPSQYFMYRVTFSSHILHIRVKIEINKFSDP